MTRRLLYGLVAACAVGGTAALVHKAPMPSAPAAVHAAGVRDSATAGKGAVTKDTLLSRIRAGAPRVGKPSDVLAEGEASAEPSAAPKVFDGHELMPMAAPGTTEAIRTALGTPPAPAAPAPLTREELVRRASQVQVEAERRVAQLDAAVGLTEHQMTSAFALYARASSSYDPRIAIEGAATMAPAAEGKSVDTQVYETLDKDQQADFGQAWLDRDLWWTEVVGQLAADFPVTTPATSATTTTPTTDTTSTSTTPTTPSVHQTDNIFDILQ